MRAHTKYFAVFATVLLLGWVAAPTVASSTEDSLSVSLSQDATGQVVVDVADNGTAVNGSVNVTATDGNYSAEGTYTVGDDGSITLAEPTEEANLTVTAAYNNSTATTSATVAPVQEGLYASVSQGSSGAVTIAVTDNGTAAAGANVTVAVTSGNYSGNGSYVADANGTVGLPAPSENATIEVTADYDNETFTTTAAIGPVQSDEPEVSFGDRVSNFVNELQNDSNVTHIGPLVAEFVLENNPGSPPDHAGPPEWLTNDSVDKERGPPDHAGPPEDNGNDKGNGADKADKGNGTDKGNQKRCTDDNPNNDKNCPDDGEESSDDGDAESDESDGS